MRVLRAILIRLGLVPDDRWHRWKSRVRDDDFRRKLIETSDGLREETDDELRERIKAACRESADGPNVREGER